MVDKATALDREAALIARSLHLKGLHEKVDDLPDDLRDRVARVLRSIERAEIRSKKGGQPGDADFEQARLKRKFSLRNI